MPTASEFTHALDAIAPQVTERQRAIVAAHLSAPDETATARQLADAVGYPKHQPVNSQYGRLAGLLAEKLGIDLPVHLELIASSNRTPGKELELTLRTAASFAFRQAGWADSTSAPRTRAVLEASALEGELRERLVLDRKRNAKLRAEKLEAARTAAPDASLRCEVPGCGFDFERVYGSIGRDFIHVHHRRPLAEREGIRATTLADLALVCANCHAMIHVGGKCRPLESLIRRAVEA